MYPWFSSKLEQAQQILNYQNLDMGFRFNSPANQDEIQQCEQELGLILPNSYKEFLKFSNGANIFCAGEKMRSEIPGTVPSWYTETGILIQDTRSLVSFSQKQYQVYIDVDDGTNYIAFAYLGSVGTGDFCGFDVTTYDGSEYKVLDCYHDVSFEEWHEEHVIASSFEDWLIKIFDEVIQNNHRPEYWLPSPLVEDWVPENPT